MAGMTSLIADELLFQVLREIGLIPQLYEEFVSNERTVVALPSRKYSRSFSMNFLAFTNEFYSGLLRQSLSVRTCSVCWEHHGQNYLCLPDFLHPDSVDLLFDILEWRRGYVFREAFVVTSTPLWLFTDQIGCASHAFLVHLLPLDEIQTWKGVSAFAYELYWNGFLTTS